MITNVTVLQHPFLTVSNFLFCLVHFSFPLSQSPLSSPSSRNGRVFPPASKLMQHTRVLSINANGLTPTPNFATMLSFTSHPQQVSCAHAPPRMPFSEKAGASPRTSPCAWSWRYLHSRVTVISSIRLLPPQQRWWQLRYGCEGLCFNCVDLSSLSSWRLCSVIISVF